METHSSGCGDECGASVVFSPCGTQAQLLWRSRGVQKALSRYQTSQTVDTSIAIPECDSRDTSLAHKAEREQFWLPSFASKAILESLTGRLPEIQPDLPMCMICMEEKDDKVFGAWKCSETQLFFCAECIVEYISSRLDIHEISPVRCPCMSCSCPLSMNHVRLCLVDHKPLLKKFNRLIDLKNPDCRECPTCEHRQDGDPTKPKMVCDNCQQEYCYFHSLAHVGKPCSAIHRESTVKRLRNKLWKTMHTKKCPKCKSRIQKNGGCPHMTCRKCRHQFCWYCAQPWSFVNKAGRTVYHCVDPVQGINPVNWRRRCYSLRMVTGSLVITALAPAAAGCFAVIYGPYAMYSSYKVRQRQKRNQRAIRTRNARAAIAYREQIELERQQQLTEQQQIHNVVMQQVSECTEVQDVMEREIPEREGVYAVLPDVSGQGILQVPVYEHPTTTSSVVRTLAAMKRFLASQVLQKQSGMWGHVKNVGWIYLGEGVTRLGENPCKRYSSEEFYHGELSQSEAKTFLINNEWGPGTFLLRHSPTSRALDNYIGQMYLSVVSETALGATIVQHFHLQAKWNGAVRLYSNTDLKLSQLKFEDMNAFLEAVKASGLCTRAAFKPYSRDETMWY